jgi:hypothetical protein
MAVVIKPTENRLAMAKPPPDKLDKGTAGKINEERKKRYNSEQIQKGLGMNVKLTCWSLYQTEMDSFYIRA